MKFAHQSATIRQHGKGMIILETALETAGLTYVFPDGNGIKNIAFQVKRGEIYALYGGHHAGKSVLLQTIIGTLRPQAGTLKLFGNIDYQKERRRIGFVPQKPVTIGSLSPADMLRYFSSVLDSSALGSSAGVSSAGCSAAGTTSASAGAAAFSSFAASFAALRSASACSRAICVGPFASV